MKKKLLTLAMAAVMVVSSAVTAFAADVYTKEWKNEKNDSYTEVENPLKGKNLEKVVITYTFNFTDGTAKNGWDGVFSFYDATSNARVSFQTAPYLCFNADKGDGADDVWTDMKADAWCTTNCEFGKDYTFEYTITKDAVTVTCDGKAIAEFKETGKGEGYTGPQQILDALNTYPTLTLGVGLAKSSFWNTELGTAKLVISDGVEAETQAPATETTTVAAGGNNNSNNSTGSTGSGDTAPVLALLAVAAVAGAVVVLRKKEVTE